MKERLQKYLARAGVASRRKAEELIAAGGVQVNNITVTEMGYKIDPEKDCITVAGKRIGLENKVYIMLNKPAGYLSTVRDDFERPTVMTLVGDIPQRLFPVGRLDYQTEGLLLLTNDGDFAYALTHPKHEKTKTYLAMVEGNINQADLDKLEEGIFLEDGPTAPAKCKLRAQHKTDAVVEIIIHEGRKRQVRRMFATVGHPVIKLSRVGEGFLTLGDLQPGQYRHLQPQEIKKLLEN